MAFEMVQIHDRVWEIPAPFGPSSKQVHTRLVLLYLVKGSKLAMIDAGAKNAPVDVIRPALNKLGYDLTDISYVLVTHGHHDHIGGNGNFKRESPNTQFILPKLDRPFAESQEVHGEFMRNMLHQYGRDDLIPARMKGFSSTLSGIGIIDGELSDGDKIDLGEGVELTLVATPGHTAGSSSYYWESEKILITGDAVSARGSYAGSWPYYNDASAQRKSLERMLSLPIEILGLGHPSHSGQPLNTPVKRGADATDILQDSLGIMNAIEGAVRARVAANPQATDLEIAQRVTLDLLDTIPTMIDPVLKVAGGPTIAAHLRELRAEGAAKGESQVAAQ